MESWSRFSSQISAGGAPVGTWRTQGGGVGASASPRFERPDPTLALSIRETVGIGCPLVRRCIRSSVDRTPVRTYWYSESS